MKRTFFVALLALAVFAGSAFAGPKEFVKGSFYLTPQVGFSSWGGSIPFGANGEYAMTENIGIGGTVMAQFWSETYWKESLITLSAEAAYHFTKLNAEKFDIYAGAGIGYSIVSVTYDTGYFNGSSAASGLNLYPLLGARYWFTPKIAASVKLNGSVLGSFTGFGAVVGVTFILK